MGMQRLADSRQLPVVGFGLDNSGNALVTHGQVDLDGETSDSPRVLFARQNGRHDGPECLKVMGYE